MFKSGKSDGKSVANIGQLIEEATNHAGENRDLCMHICDLINSSSSPEGLKEVVKCIRKRFTTKNPQVIMQTMVLLEACMKYCGMRFHVLVTTKDFLQDFLKIINPKNNPSAELQVMVLGLLQMWAFSFQSYPELKEVCKMYQDLKNKRVEFPPINPDQSIKFQSVSPTTASTTIPIPVPQSGKTYSSISPAGHQKAQQSRSTGNQHPAAVKRTSSNDATPGSVGAADIRAEINTTRQSCTVFRELMSGLNSGEETTSDLELLEDMNSTCHRLQKRILQLVERVNIEDLTVELLTTNDELNNAFRFYDKIQRSIVEQMGEGNDNFIQHVSMPSTEGIAGDNLIDFDDSEPSLLTDIDREFVNMSLDGSNKKTTSHNVPSELKPSTNELPIDREQEIAEMEQWLKEAPGDQHQDGTNVDFEQFLQTRLHENDSRPSLQSSQNATTPKNPF